MLKKAVIAGLILILFMIIGLVGHHYYEKNIAKQKLNEFIAAYDFPERKVDIQSIYEPIKRKDTYVKEVYIEGDKENYYVFSYNTKEKTVDLMGVVDGGNWVDVNDHAFKKLKYQPSAKFIKKLRDQKS